MYLYNLLRCKGIRVPISCALCVGEVEHLLHLFFDCNFAKACWLKVGLSYNMWAVESAPEWLLDKLSTETSENLIKIVTVLWGIWWARNKCIWENKIITPEIAVAWSSRQLSDWREANKKRALKNIQVPKPAADQVNKWVRPSPGTYKINVDASVFTSDNHFSIGMVLRDQQGHFVRGKVCRFAGCVSVLEAELVGILEASIWSTNLPSHVFEIESDSQLGVNAIHSNMHNYLEAGDLVEHCRLLIRNQAGVSVSHVKKQANRVAHLLARLPCSINSFIDLWSPPSCVLETLLSDICF